MKPQLAVFAFCVALTAVVLACGDDHSHSLDSGTTLIPQACQDIIDACHDLDMGSGPEHDCHENAHSIPVAASCEADRAMCLAACGVDAGSSGADAGSSMDSGTM